MKGYLLALVGLVVFLSACSGNLKRGPNELKAQRVDSCTYQGEVFQAGNSVGGEITANCRVVKDGYDYVRASVVLYKSPTNASGSWKFVSESESQIIAPQSPSVYNIKFDRLNTERYCLDGRNYFKARIRIVWRDTPTYATGTTKGATGYYTPVKRLPCDAGTEN